MAGGRIDVEVAIDGRNAPNDLQKAMAPALGQAKQFAGALGLAFGGAAVAASVKEVISIGNDYTTTMNTLQSVTTASADQMATAGARAKELGNDITLPGVSASDAAAAMTELAKGGFSVEQAMSAAKGTLQLAGAAQIDAATAATIQSQALQSFGLSADYAAKTSDVLANAANASSAEITDVAAGLAQSGAVANQFGLSIEDTAATLGVLANAGITGSDAGTLLKSTLLALTDQSKPAQGAIETLGLTVYNANGEFVGMAALFEQLDAAAASMSEEQYQAATATLFGSDAMRLAGVAAEQGRAGFDSMREAVDRQGAAAEVAAAKTKGLPGAMASAQNAAETLALGVYDLIDGPLEGLATQTASFISDATPRFIDGLSSMGSALEPVVKIGGDLLGVISDLPAPVQAVGAALAAVKFSGLDDSIGERVSSWREQLTSFRDEMAGEQEMQAALAGISGGDTANPFQELTADAEDMSSALEENAEPLSEMAAGLATLERRSPAIRSMAEGYRGVTTRAGEFANRQRDLASQSGALGGAFRNATARAGELGGVMGGAAVAGARGLTSAAKGVVGVLGGPWMVGIMAATMVVSQITGEMGKAGKQQDILRESSDAVSVAQRDMAKAFQESNGAVSEAVVGTVVTQIDSIRSSLEQTAETAPGAFSVFTAGAADIKGWFSGTAEAGTDALNAQEDAARSAEVAKGAIDSLGLSNEELASKVYGSDTAWATFAANLGNKEGGAEAVIQLQGLRDAAEQAREVAKNTTPGFYDMAEAVRVLADESSTADDRVNALKTALDIITGKQIPLSDAVQGYNDTLRELAENTGTVVDRTQGFGDALIGVNGAVNTQTANGSALRDQLVGLRDETVGLADATIRAAIEQGDTLPQAQEKARQAIAGNEQALLNLGNQYGVNQTAIQGMAEAEGLLNKDIIMLASLTGASDVTGQLTVIKGLLDANAGGVEIPTTALTEETIAQLRNVGAVVETDINGKPGVVRVSAPNETALAQLQAVIDRNLPDKNVRVTAATEEAEAKLLELQNRQYIARLQVQVANGDMNYGQAVAAAFNQQAALRDAAAGRADGGSITGPGGPREDNILIAASSGEHMFDTGDVQNMGGQQAVYDFRAGLDRGMKPMLVPAYADGGEITSGGAPIDSMARIKNFGASKNGQDYVYGGVGPVGYDCSGYVSGAYAEAMGLAQGTRYFTTESDFEALGFVPGLGGPNDMSIGVNRGGGGPYSHMAMTVGGVNGEASDFVQWGGSAKGAAEFPLQWHLPGTAFNPPYLGVQAPAATAPASTGQASTWTESKSLELDSARVSVQQAMEDRAAVDADVKKSPADRDQARIKVERAEARVKELEAKKLEAETAPSATETSTTSPTSAAKEPSSGISNQLTTPTQWSEALGGIAKDFVTENVSDILGYYDASDDMGPIIGAITAGVTAANQPKGPDVSAPRPTPEQFSTDELARQAPVASGEPNWLQQMIDSLEKNPVRLFDTGGIWKSGTFGLNMSGQDEEVLTGAQRTSVMRELALTRADRASQSIPQQREPRPITNNTTINAPGSDRRELARGIRMAQSEEQWRLNSVRVGES